jgi:hypothetical protein
VVSLAVTEIMQIWASSRLVNGPTSVPFWHGCERARKLNVAVSYIFISETFTTSVPTKDKRSTVL